VIRTLNFCPSTDGPKEKEMKNRGLSCLLAGLLVLMLALPAFSQGRTPIVVTKYTKTGVNVTADGNLWTTAQPAMNFGAALVSVRKTGTVTGCTLTTYTGPTAATATAAVNDANAAIDCHTASVNKIIINLDQYFQMTVSSWAAAGGSVDVYVTLTNGSGWNLNATLSAVTQSTGSGAAGTYWYIRQTDGTNTAPTGDAVARRSYVQGTDGTNSMPAGDTQARAIQVTPGNGTNADKQMLDGVGALGAGVKQVATLGTLSAAVASASMTQVVAVNAGARVLLGVIIETATNAAGIVTVSTGTGTNCGTGTATKVVFGIGTATSPLPVGYYPVNALVAAGSAICLTTDASTTSARVLTQ
jgi:hypothetical protein